MEAAVEPSVETANETRPVDFLVRELEGAISVVGSIASQLPDVSLVRADTTALGQFLEQLRDRVRDGVYRFPTMDTTALTPPPPPEVPTDAPIEIKLNADQATAWLKITRWADDPDKPYFVLKGYAGTGKTFLMKMLRDLKNSIFYTAPNNKPAKVLSKAIGVRAKTTFALLGLRMEQKEDELVMEYGKKLPYFPKNSILVVDECSMVNKQLVAFIDQVVKDFGIKVLYVGDPAQLPPVGEKTSKSWRVTDDPECRAMLKKVERFDNQLLALSIRIRECLKDRRYVSPIFDDNDGEQGVWLLESRRQFEKQLMKLTQPTDFLDQKVVAWRNKTVAHYNELIRENFGFKKRFCIGDLLMLAAPIIEDEKVIAHIDDEFVVQSVDKGIVTVEGKKVRVWLLTVVGDDQTLLLHVPIKPERLNKILALKATKAKNAKGGTRRRLWEEFWEIKNKFHEVRYSYAITGHRIQGTTIHTVYLDQFDMLLNRNKPEAFRSLMVGATRPTTRLFTY